MLARRLAVTALIVPALLSAGCTSSGSDGKSSAPAGSPAAVATLAATLQKGIAGLTSAHLDVDAGPLGGTVAADVTFRDGQTTASRLMLDQGQGDVDVITVDGTSYAKLPSGRNTSGKPWLKVSSTSSNEFVRGLAGTLGLANAATSLGSVSGLLETSATSVKDDGTEQVNGVSADHYALTIDPTKATGDLGSALSAAGSKPLPVDLWVDSLGRPVQIKIAIPFGGQSLPLLVKVSKFNAAVHIQAPPADQIGPN